MTAASQWADGTEASLERVSRRREERSEAEAVERLRLSIDLPSAWLASGLGLG